MYNIFPCYAFIYCSIKFENYPLIDDGFIYSSCVVLQLFLCLFDRQRGKVSGKILGLLFVRAVRSTMEEFVLVKSLNLSASLPIEVLFSDLFIPMKISLG